MNSRVSRVHLVNTRSRQQLSENMRKTVDNITISASAVVCVCGRGGGSRHSKPVAPSPEICHRFDRTHACYNKIVRIDTPQVTTQTHGFIEYCKR